MKLRATLNVPEKPCKSILPIAKRSLMLCRAQK